MNSLIAVFWFLLPAAVANMAPVIFRRVPILATPIDFGRKINTKPILGPNKTYRGLVSGIGLAIITVWLQKHLISLPDKYWLVNYHSVSIVWLGFVLGIGALGGDMIESFIKRQLDINSGRSWVPFDQIDWIVGALVLSNFVADFDVKQVVAALLVFGLLHPLANIVGYSLKLKPNKF